MKYIIALFLSTPLVACQGFRYTGLSSRPPTQISKHELPSKQIQIELQNPYISPYGDVPRDDHPEVDKWINYFQAKGREHMEKYLSRSSHYIPMMKQVLREYQLPEDLVYIAMIESGFNPRAHSNANAVGYWQFIAGTARRYGLSINGFVDERRDPVLSTRAAAEYFKDLYSAHESWYLALASYNAGESRIFRAIRTNFTRDFWYLASINAFPRETRNYIPKFIAATRIAQNPEKYGFTNINYQDPMEYDTVDLAFPINLKTLASKLGISYKEMRLLNPRYRGAYVPLESKRNTTIRLPLGKKEHATKVIAQCKMKTPKYIHSDYFWYRVRMGDTLYGLARRYHTRVSTIQRINNMPRRRVLLAGQKIKMPYYNHFKKGKKLAKTHIVRRGENLHSIANRYRIKVSNLQQLNNLSGSTIYPGQTLKLVQYKVTSQNPKHKVHTVRRGDTLIDIAKKYRVPLPDLMRINNLKFNSVIKIGARITIPK